MPGVIIIESLAQVGAVILLSHPDYKKKLPILLAYQMLNLEKRTFQETN
jgi:3-hydroxymyristoyl/3-hydroxydecanoyl-(acyl carrier protein) dehydratase